MFPGESSLRNTVPLSGGDIGDKGAGLGVMLGLSGEGQPQSGLLLGFIPSETSEEGSLRAGAGLLWERKSKDGRGPVCITRIPLIASGSAPMAATCLLIGNRRQPSPLSVRRKETRRETQEPLYFVPCDSRLLGKIYVVSLSQ